MVKTLIKHGADPKLDDCDGQTALHKVHQMLPYRDHAEGGPPPPFCGNIINLVKHISKIEKDFHVIIVVS